MGDLHPIFLEMSKIERKWVLSYAEKNFQLEQIEQDRDVFLDSVRRNFRILNHQFIWICAWYLTIDLRSWQRRTSLIFEERNRTQIFYPNISPCYKRIFIFYGKSSFAKFWYMKGYKSY